MDTNIKPGHYIIGCDTCLNYVVTVSSDEAMTYWAEHRQVNGHRPTAVELVESCPSGKIDSAIVRVVFEPLSGHHHVQLGSIDNL